MELFNLKDLAKRFNLSYKQIFNRLDKVNCRLNIAGLSIQAHKDKRRWFIWSSDLEAAGPVLPAPTKKKMKTAPAVKKIKSLGIIDPSKSGRG